MYLSPFKTMLTLQVTIPGWTIFSIVDRELHNPCSTISEVKYIRINDASLKRKIGGYHLLYI